jgi:dihydrofolate synthase/folylpolyglutamate synthase
MERVSIIREHLFSLTTLGIKYDLDRMVAAAAAIGNPHNRYPCFHVAGTNGKGSVCAYLESGLRACGHKTGLFMSPHLVRFEERFLIDGRPIAESAWLAVYDSLVPVIDNLKLTFFEATTLIAFEIFRQERVDWAVFETGLGGRLDATNVVKPRISLITRLAIDHTGYLGDDLLSIAGEKLGIVKNAVPCIMALPDQPAIAGLAASICKDRRAPLRLIDNSMAMEIVIGDQGATFSLDGRRYRINLAGGYQVTNALLAVSAMHEAGIGDHDAIARGLENARLPGRFQVVAVRGKRIVFDVGHNPDSAMSFCRALRYRFHKGESKRALPSFCIVLGIMKDKDYAGMLPHYARLAKRLLLAKPATSRAAATADLRRFVPPDFAGECHEFQDTMGAIDAALDGQQETIVVAGSFFTVGEAMRYLGIEPYDSLMMEKLPHIRLRSADHRDRREADDQDDDQKHEEQNYWQQQRACGANPADAVHDMEP